MSDLERQRAEIEDAFRGFAVRFDGKNPLDGGFAELVSEHLKLARDEGAKLAATAYAEAEKIEVPAEANTKSFADLRDAINDISTKTSQSAILSALVERAAEFAPRGAFFIIKNEHLTGWKAFGDGGAEQAVHNIYFPLSMNSILGHAAESRSTVEAGFGEHSEDNTFLEGLHFGQPDRMYAIPLLARGRGVAVLYVDHGMGAGAFNLEALETLVRIAGMTVELVAAPAPAPAVQEEPAVEEQPVPVRRSSAPMASELRRKPTDSPIRNRFTKSLLKRRTRRAARLSASRKRIPRITQSSRHGIVSRHRKKMLPPSIPSPT